MRGEVNIRKKSGEVIEVLMSADTIEVSGVDYLLTMAQDITEQKRVEKLLRESEERLKLAIESSELGIWDYDISTRRFTGDERWVGIWGYTVEAVAEKNIHWQERVHPDDLPKGLYTWERFLSGQIDNYECEYRMMIYAMKKPDFVTFYCNVCQATSG